MRLYLVNTANTRIFNVAVPGARMKLVGGDSGRYERETFVDEVLLAPSERAVVDVLFDTPGEVRLEHRTPDHVYDLGGFSVAGTRPAPAGASFDMLRVDPDSPPSIDRSSTTSSARRTRCSPSSPRCRCSTGDGDAPATSYACPDAPGGHVRRARDVPEVRDEAGARPIQADRASYVCPMHPEVTSSEPGRARSAA